MRYQHITLHGTRMVIDADGYIGPVGRHSVMRFTMGKITRHETCSSVTLVSQGGQAYQASKPGRTLWSGERMDEFGKLSTYVEYRATRREVIESLMRSHGMLTLGNVPVREEPTCTHNSSDDGDTICGWCGRPVDPTTPRCEGCRHAGEDRVPTDAQITNAIANDKRVRATVAVSVTLKIEATGQTPDKLISNATLSALEVVEDAITHRHGQPNDQGWHSLADVIEHTGIVPDPCHLSIEGATALVNQEAIERVFEEN